MELRVDDRQSLPPGFTLDDGVDITGPRTADSLCLVYDASGRGERPLKVKEYFPAGLACRREDHLVQPLAGTDREVYDAGLQSFIAFCERLAAIEHKAVEPLLGLIEGYGTAYLVLDQPRGVGLNYWLDALGRAVTAAELETLARGLCEGLAVAHAADLLHLDLAPDTVFVQRGAEPMIANFAATEIAFAASAGRPLPPAKAGYAPPEREDGDLAHIGQRSDIYSVAAILYRLVVGAAPPPAATRRTADTVADRLAALQANAPPAMRHAIAAGLSLDPMERPGSAADFAALMRGGPLVTAQAPRRPGTAAVEAARAPSAPVQVPSSREPVRRPPQRAPKKSAPPRPIVLAAVGGACMIGAAFAYGLLGSSSEPEPVPVVNAVPKRVETVSSERPASSETPVRTNTAASREGALDAAAESALKTGERFRECPGCPELVVLPAGSFTMGSAASDRGHEADEGPQRRVEIRSRLAMSRGAVTRAEFELFVAATSYRPASSCRVFEGGKWVERSDLSFRNPGFAQMGDHPVVCVNWSDARAYTDWLSTRTGKRYRLPTEAEWEYAARAGTTTPFWWGSDISTDQANYDGSLVFGAGAVGTNRQATVPVLQFEPNAFGLYQVHGNVSQWVEDCWNPNYRGAPTDATARVEGDCARRVLRGGSWGYAPKDLRVTYREGATATNRNFNFGFRIVRVFDGAR